MTVDPKVVENRLHTARTRLILDKPFLGALVLRLPLRQADPRWCRTTATDAKHLYYNSEFIGQLNPAELQFVLAHEALHCGLSHFARRGHRVRHLWDVACDYAINPLLIDDGLTPPPGSLVMREYRGMTAEEIYPMLGTNEDVETLDQHVYDSDEPSEGARRENRRPGERGNDSARTRPKPVDGHDDNVGQDAAQQLPEPGDQASGQPQPEDRPNSTQGTDGAEGAPKPDPLSRAELETLSLQWQQRVVGAAQQAMQAGKLGKAMARLIDYMVQPTLPWRMLLSRYVSSVARDDYNYSRPSTRRGDPAIFPSLRSAQIHMTIAVDVSGSIGAREIGEFLSEINSLKAQFRCEVELLACDARLAAGCPWVFHPWEELTLPREIKGGGGTSFCPAFEHAEHADRQPDVLIYFTDAKGEFPAREPGFPVIWLVKGRAPVPFGQRVQLN